MKGAIIGYVAIIAVLIVAVISAYYFGISGTSSKEVTTTEGLLVSSENFNFFLLKTLNQSIEFIAQRAAYDLALNGGFIEGREVFWNYNYPQISDLEKNLANRIGSNLPSSYKKFDRTVILENTKIRIDEQLPLSASKYFDVGGYANISIYDETVRSKTFSNFNINSRAISSYFRLLYVAREILTNTTFNSSLNDANALLGNLTDETNPIGGRFQGLSFGVNAVGDIVDISIEDLCYPTNTYCLAPLNPNEPRTKTDINTGQLIPYENLKLRFKIKAQQTGSTPSSCKFSISLNPVMGSAATGDEVDVPLSVINLGTTSDAVTLNAKVYNKTTMTEDHTITVNFDDNGEPIPYNTIMRIKTDSLTLGGPYIINVTGDGCSPNQEIFTTYDLTVNPAMTFSISVDKDPVTLINNIGLYSNSTNVFVNKLTGVSENVLLSVAGLPAGVGYSLSQNGMPPNFPSVFSVLTLTTDGNTPQGDHTITIKGIGGGSYSEKQFTLHVDEPFDFSFDIQGIPNDNIFRNKSTSRTLAVKTTSGTPEPVGFSYDVVNSTGDTDPSNYYITVQFIPNPCPLTPLIPDCYPTMNIVTTQNTPADTYAIHLNAIATYVSKQVSFDLTVKWGCGDDIILSPEQCEGANLGGSDQCTIRFPFPPGIGGHQVTGGTLTCIPSGQPGECTLKTSDCEYCSNNRKDAGEECDGTDDTQCPSKCKADCTCPRIYEWNCSDWLGGGVFPGSSVNFAGPNCRTNWYPVSCLTENFYLRHDMDAGKYGEDQIQKMKIEGNHCLVRSRDSIVPDNEQGRMVCTLCTNKQPTIEWGVTTETTGSTGGIYNVDGIDWWKITDSVGTLDYLHIEGRGCPSGTWPFSCVFDENESFYTGDTGMLVDLYIEGGVCKATYRNAQKWSQITIGTVCTNKSYGNPVWGPYKASSKTGLMSVDQREIFGSPWCDLLSPNPLLVSVFSKSDHTNPSAYLEDALQSFEYWGGPHPWYTTVWAIDDSTYFDLGGWHAEHNRTIGILCAPYEE